MNTHPLKVSLKHDDKALSKEQKRFNLLTEKIDKHKQKLSGLKTDIATLEDLIRQEYQPESQRFKLMKLAFMRELDQAARQQKLSKRDQKRLSLLIENLAYNALTVDSDPALKEIFQYWCGVDIDEEFQAQQRDEDALIRAQLKQQFDIDLPDDFDFDDELAREKIDQLMREKFPSSEDDEASSSANSEAPRSAKHIAKQARLEQQEKEVSLSLREVYRKLASLLHPDREADEHKRQEKTALLQEVNAAYEARDLLKLLEFQLKLEQIDQQHLDGLNPLKLKHYIQVLADQERELRDEISFLNEQIAQHYNQGMPVTAKTLCRRLQTDIKEMKGMTKSLKSDIDYFHGLPDIKFFLAAI